jgi:nucleotide-binding universal stress UspA family protein
MTEPLLTRLVVPIANEDDMEATGRALSPHLSEGTDRLVVVHVIEKAGGYMDKAPLEARQEQAERVFEIADDRFVDQSGYETQLRYGTDVVEEILAVASEIDATAIAFTPRKSNRLTRLLSGDEEHRLITESSCPVLAFQKCEEGYRWMGEN